MGGFSSSCTGTIRSAPGCAQSGNPHRPEAIRVPVARTRSPTTNAVPCDGSRPVPRPTSTPRRQRPGSEAPELTYKGPTGAVAHELLYRHDEQRLEIVEAGRPREFRWPPVPSLFPKRIAFASRTCSTRSLGVHTSLAEPLAPSDHGGREAMLPRQP